MAPLGDAHHPISGARQTRPCRALRNVTWCRSVMMVFVMKPMAGERRGRNCEHRVVRRCRGFPFGLICESSDLRRPSPQDPGAGVQVELKLLLYIVIVSDCVVGMRGGESGGCGGTQRPRGLRPGHLAPFHLARTCGTHLAFRQRRFGDWDWQGVHV